MAIKFTKHKYNASLSNEYFKISVSNVYESSVGSETYATQCDKIKRLLNGERNLRPIFSNSNGESLFTINDKGMFILNGGEYGPPFGSNITITCDYESNKTEIDNFMKFMLTCENEDDDDDYID